MRGGRQTAVDQLPAALVYAGFSFGVLPRRCWPRPGPAPRVRCSTTRASDVGVRQRVAPRRAVRIHGMDADPFFAGEGDIDAARALVKESRDAESSSTRRRAPVRGQQPALVRPRGRGAPHRAHARVPRRDPLIVDRLTFRPRSRTGGVRRCAAQKGFGGAAGPGGSTAEGRTAEQVRSAGRRGLLDLLSARPGRRSRGGVVVDRGARRLGSRSRISWSSRMSRRRGGSSSSPRLRRAAMRSAAAR